MNQIIAMHGWAGHAGLWYQWKRVLEQDGWLWQSAERGYGSAPPWTPSWRHGPGERVVIAHSLGLHLLTEEQLKHATAIALLGCFPSFVPAGPAGRALRAGLRGMRTALGSKGECIMLQRFFAKAAAPLSINALPASPLLAGLSVEGRQRLGSDLSLLERCCGLPAAWPQAARVLVVQGAKDAVVAETCQQQLLDLLDSQDCQICRDQRWGHALLTTDVLTVVHAWLRKR